MNVSFSVCEIRNLSNLKGLGIGVFYLQIVKISSEKSLWYYFPKWK